MNPEISFKENSQQRIENYLKGGKCMFVMIDQDSDNICAILTGKKFFENLPVAISEDTNCEEIKSIELEWQAHEYTIHCNCTLIQDGEEEERVFEIHRTVVYK